MGSRGRRRQQWAVQPLTPLMEGPDLEMHDESTKKETSWELIREWFRIQKSIPPAPSSSGSSGFTMSFYGTNIPSTKRQDLRLLLGVLGCPLAPIPVASDATGGSPPPFIQRLNSLKDIPFETSTAHYIIQQYLAAAGCLKQQQDSGMMVKNMYTTGVVKMICCETEVSLAGGKGTSGGVKTLGSRSGENGCFVLWQMSPGMWSLELAVGTGHKVIAGSDGKIVWRHTPWLGTHAAKGPHRPLRRIIQGLDPKSTACLFAKAQCLGEKRIGDDDCFVLKVAADREAVMERNDGPAEVIRHVLYGYFSQKSGLLIYLEDSHLTRVVQSPPPPADSGGGRSNTSSSDEEGTAVYWETTIGSSIGDYRDVDGVMIAHQGRTIATVFRFSESSMEHSRTRMEEIWRIDDVVFNVPGLSIDSFLPPAEIFVGNNNLTSI